VAIATIAALVFSHHVLDVITNEGFSRAAVIGRVTDDNARAISVV
jgi:hypothetical protein